MQDADPPGEALTVVREGGVNQSRNGQQSLRVMRPRAISADFTSTSSPAPRRVASQQAMLSEVTSQLALSSVERPARRQGSQTAAVADAQLASVSASPKSRLQGLKDQAELLHRQDRHPMGGKLAHAKRRLQCADGVGERSAARHHDPRRPRHGRQPLQPVPQPWRVVQAAAELDDPPRRHPEPPDPLGGRQPMQHRLVKLLGAPAPWLMGVVNVTPDSFSDGGRHLAPDAAIAHGRRLLDEGAQILDLGGELTAPGSRPIT